MKPADAEGREAHPLLHQLVRDIASRREAILTAVVHEWRNGRLLRIAHLESATGAAWTTSADNIGPALGRDAPDRCRDR